MEKVRMAGTADVSELVRLRGVMFGDIAERESGSDEWRRHAKEMLQARLDEESPNLVAFVVDREDRPGALASCAVGAVDYRLGGPDNVSGKTGYIFNVATDPDQRRRGFSRSCMAALIDWYRSRGIRTVDLRASPEGEPLYRALGFARTSHPAMRLRL